MEWFSTSRHFVLERFVDKKKLINPILKKGRRHTSKENGEVLFFYHASRTLFEFQIHTTAKFAR